MRVILALLIGFLLSGCSTALAGPEWTEANVIKALAGEAGGQGEAELLAHAHAIRNRGDLKGVYGLRAHPDALALKRARNAWNEAKTRPSSVSLCDHWLSDYDLKHSRPSLIAWRHKAVYSVKVGSTTFYRLK